MRHLLISEITQAEAPQICFRFEGPDEEALVAHIKTLSHMTFKAYEDGGIGSVHAPHSGTPPTMSKDRSRITKEGEEQGEEESHTVPDEEHGREDISAP